ncbi:MAG: hypothetical protein KY467_13975 [Gemmatimonadetes bacterium]|nr:hypothetical protein [Gemmatimonadota bacterium]
MKRITFAALLFAAAALSACGPVAAGLRPAPRADLISRAEIEATPAADAHELVQRLRADWLIVDGQPAVDEVLVFVDGRLLGNVRSLRGLSLDRVGALQLHSPNYVRETFARFPHREFRMAIAVSTFTQAEEARYRGSVSMGAGLSIRSLAHQVKASADDLGFSHHPPANWADRGREMPVTVHLGARYGLRPRLWLAGEVQHTPRAWYGGYRHPPDMGSGLLSVSAASTEMALQLSTGGMVRATAGPALRMVQWDWRSGECQCEEPRSNSNTALGLAVAVEATVPRSSRFFLDIGFRGRYFPSQEAGPYREFESIGARGLTFTPTLGLGVRF